MTTITTSERCEKCRGIGEVPSGYGTLYGGLAYRVCPACDGRGTVAVEPQPTPPAGALTIDGETVTAPGFTAGTFDRAIHRAHCDGLQVAPTDRGDCVLVSNPQNGASYTVSRAQCSCKAGRTHGHCKHRALAIFMHDIMHQRPATPATVAA